MYRIDSVYDASSGVLLGTTVASQLGLAQITHRVQLVGQK